MNNLLPEVLGERGAAAEGNASGSATENPFGSLPDEDEVSGTSTSESTAIAIEEEVAADLGQDGGTGTNERVDAKRNEAKKKWKAGVELATLESKKGSVQWVPDSDMVEFFKTVTSIDENLVEMGAEITKLEALHVKSKITTSVVSLKDLRDEMASCVKRCSLTSQSTLGLFSHIENARKAKVSALSQQKQRMRVTILDAKRRQFKKVMSKFSSMRVAVQEDYREVVTRRYETVMGERPTEEDVDEMIRTGESEAIFKKAILTQGRGQVADTLSEIDERHRTMVQVEKGLLELQQIFLDLATVVDQQSEVIDNIECHVNTASEFTNEGAKVLQVSAALHKSIQRKKLCIVILIAIGIVILGCILGPVIKSAIDSANAQSLAQAQRRQAAATLAQTKYEQERDRRAAEMNGTAG